MPAIWLSKALPSAALPHLPSASSSISKSRESHQVSCKIISLFIAHNSQKGTKSVSNPPPYNKPARFLHPETKQGTGGQERGQFNVLIMSLLLCGGTCHACLHLVITAGTGQRTKHLCWLHGSGQECRGCSPCLCRVYPERCTECPAFTTCALSPCLQPPTAPTTSQHYPCNSLLSYAISVPQPD